jgi:flagellar protein FlaJ
MRLGKFGKMKINKSQVIGIIVALITLILSFAFMGPSDVFYFLVGISFIIAGFPFFLAIVMDSNTTREKEEMFLEFARNLVESVRAGTPISKSILNIKNKDYGTLNPHIEKLSNQIFLGIPLKNAFETFARDLGSPTITRAVGIISESEKAGGQIEDILESVATSVSQIEKLRKERRAAMYTLVVQGYIIFMIFIVIMLVMQFKIIPIASSLGGTMGDSGTNGGSGGGMGMGGVGSILGGGAPATPEELSRPFFWLLIVQGFFAGIVIGKISEGNVLYGLKHSFILLVLALLINSGAQLFLGKPA